MGTTVKSLFQSFNEVPEGKFPPEYYSPRIVRSFIFGNYAYPLGLLVHALFFAIFALVGVTILALFNVVSVILWATAFLIHRKGYFGWAYFFVIFEIIAHSVLCVMVIGWATGFQYYVLLHPTVVFFFHWSTPRKAAIAAIYGCSKAAMNYYYTISLTYIEQITL